VIELLQEVSLPENVLYFAQLDDSRLGELFERISIIILLYKSDRAKGAMADLLEHSEIT